MQPGDSGCGAAPSRVHRRNGAAAAVGDEQGRAVGDTNRKHQRRITADQAVGSRPVPGLTSGRIDHCGTVNLVNGRERVPGDAAAGRELLPLRLAIGHPRDDSELPGRPPMDRESSKRDALQQCAPGLPGPRERSRKRRRLGTDRIGHRFRESNRIVE